MGINIIIIFLDIVCFLLLSWIYSEKDEYSDWNNDELCVCEYFISYFLTSRFHANFLCDSLLSALRTHCVPNITWFNTKVSTNNCKCIGFTHTHTRNRPTNLSMQMSFNVRFICVRFAIIIWFSIKVDQVSLHIARWFSAIYKTVCMQQQQQQQERGSERERAKYTNNKNPCNAEASQRVLSDGEVGEKWKC